MLLTILHQKNGAANIAALPIQNNNAFAMFDHVFTPLLLVQQVSFHQYIGARLQHQYILLAELCLCMQHQSYTCILVELCHAVVPLGEKKLTYSTIDKILPPLSLYRTCWHGINVQLCRENYTVKKGSRVSVSSPDVTDQTPPGQE